MARDHFQIIVAENLTDAAADVSVTRAVKSPAFRFVLILPFKRHRVGTNLGRDRFVKACLQSRDQRNARKRLPKLTHGLRIRRVVSRSHIRQFLHPREQRVVHNTHSTELAGEDGFETDPLQLRSILQTSVLRIRQLFQTERYRRCMIGNVRDSLVTVITDLNRTVAVFKSDPVDAAASQLLLGRHVEEPILETRRTQIRDQNFHNVVLHVRQVDIELLIIESTHDCVASCRTQSTLNNRLSTLKQTLPACWRPAVR